MVYSTSDKVVLPSESGKFSTYKENTMDIIPIEETTMYYNLGLDKFKDDDRLHIYNTDCEHDEHKEYECFIKLHDMFKKFCL